MNTRLMSTRKYTILHLVTCFFCSNGNLCVVSSHIHSDWNDIESVGIEWVQWMYSKLSHLRVSWCIEHSPCLQFSVSNPVLSDYSIVSVFWRVVPADMDAGWSSEQNSYISWLSNRSCS